MAEQRAKAPAHQIRGWRSCEGIAWVYGRRSSREGLSETPERVVRAWSEYCAGYCLTHDDFKENVWESREIFEPVILRDIFLFLIAISLSTNQWICGCCLCAIGANCWHLQNCQSCRVFCEKAADARNDDSPNCKLHTGQPYGCWNGSQVTCYPCVHDK